MRRAYSLIELILAVIILAIISSIGINLMLILYKNYDTSKHIMNLQFQSQNTLEQIAKLLAVRIPQSVIAKDWASKNFSPLSINKLANSDTLEFITYTPEAFFTGIYSGFVDLAKSSKQTITTPQSNLKELEQTIKDLNPKFGNNFELAMVFKSLNYNASDFGYEGNKPNLALVKVAENTKFLLDNSKRKDKLISEHYHIAHTAYAIKIEHSKENIQNDLVLYFNYRPWLGERASDGDRVILAKNVSTFVFRSNDDVIEIKLCLSNENLDTMCKGKVIQ